MDYSLLIGGTLLLLLVAISLAAILSRNLLTGIIAFSVFSLLMALLYTLMGAPDVAMTEAAVGAGASTLILLAALHLLGEEEEKPRHQWLALLAMLPIFALLLYTLKDMPAYGNADTPSYLHVAQYYITQTKVDIGIPNIVTAVLASYRGYDTLGETTVILTAGLAVWLLLGVDKKSGNA